METRQLIDGRSMPPIGFGTWQLEEGREAQQSVLAALGCGYRLVDTAAIYGNEQSVGEAVSQSDVPREQVFLTTKLWTRAQGYESAIAAFHESLAYLDLDYVDLYLIHWPGSDRKARVDSWRALSDIQKSGKAKSIGVSNFEISHLQDFIDTFDNLPAVNQIEFNPFNYARQKQTLRFCDQHNIVVEAYSPLGIGRVDNPAISEITDDIGRTNAQVMLRWAIQHGTVPIPRSADPDHIRQNLEVFDFELDKKQMSQIDSLS
jgi:diketogulonate reductase-like aldo/keto reductase